MCDFVTPLCQQTLGADLYFSKAAPTKPDEEKTQVNYIFERGLHGTEPDLPTA